MNSLCIVIRKGPYGSISAAEAVRHVIGAVHAGMTVHAVLVDDGVYLARQGQDAADSGWTSLSGALGQAVGPGAAGSSAPALAHIHRPSAETRGLDHVDLVPGVELIDDAQLEAVLTSADAILIF